MKDADRYVWLIANMGTVAREAEQWQPGRDKPLLVYLQEFIDKEIPKVGDGWIEKQRKLLNQ